MLQQTIKNILQSPRFEALTREAMAANPIFTRSSIRTAVQAIQDEFLDIRVEQSHTECDLRVGVVCAGNIPMVGFADMFHALRTGAEVYLKTSRRDPLMLAFDSLCHVVQNLPQDIDILLAMGNDQTMQALRGEYPDAQMVLRGHRHSVAIIDGSESIEDIEKLGNDMFLHAAMGCRSVVHIFVPQGYQIEKLRFAPRKERLPNVWYDNYKYQCAMHTMRGETFIDRNFFILIQTDDMPLVENPQTIVSYSFYTEISKIILPEQKIQCVVAHKGYEHLSRVDFGCAQFPSITDHADGVDVYEIIKEKSISINKIKPLQIKFV